MKANAFDILKKIGELNTTDLVMFPASNIKNVNAGSKGWGSLTMAIRTDIAQEIMRRISTDAPLMVNLLVINPEVFTRIKTEMESAQPEAGEMPDQDLNSLAGLLLQDPETNKRLVIGSRLERTEDGGCTFDVTDPETGQKWKHTIYTEEI